MKQNNHKLYQDLLEEIELANNVFVSAVQDLKESHMRNVEEILRTHLLTDEEGTDVISQDNINATLLSQSIRAQLEKPVTVVAPELEEANEESEEMPAEQEENTLSSLIAGQLNKASEPVERKSATARPISEIIQELRRSVEHTIDHETDTTTEEAIAENLSASDDTDKTENDTAVSLAGKIKLELLSQQIKKQLQ